MKRILFPLAFVVGLAAAAFSGAHGATHSQAIVYIDHPSIVYID